MTSENKQTAWSAGKRVAFGFSLASDWLNSWRSNKQTNCVAVGFILASDWLKSYGPIMKHIGKKITAVPNYVRHNWKLLQQTPTQRSLSALHLTSFHCNFSSWRRLLHLRWWRRTSPVRQGRLFQVLPQGLPRRACYNPWEVDLSVALLWWLR